MAAYQNRTGVDCKYYQSSIDFNFIHTNFFIHSDYFAASWKDSAETMTIGSAVQLMKAEFAHRGLPEQPLRLDKASCLPRLQSLTLATAPCTPFTPC